MEKRENEMSVTFKYKFADNYNPVYVNGAYGGVSPRGEIIANFFLERLPLPNSVTHKVDENGIVGEIIDERNNPRDLNKSFIRFVQSGIVVNIETAKQIRDWLDKHIKLLENNTNE